MMNGEKSAADPSPLIFFSGKDQGKMHQLLDNRRKHDKMTQ